MYTLDLKKLFLAALIIPLLTAPVFADEDEEKDEDEPKSEAVKQKRLEEEKEVKAEFKYTFSDVAKYIVIVECENSSGSGFIAKMDGKTYLITNQHVILGSDQIRFTTATGEQLKPLGVELAANRDIARLELPPGTEGLELSGNMAIGSKIAVFGNSEGGSVATELYGKIKSVGADVIEVTADFVGGNSGSPVLNLEKGVVGIASYVRYYTGKKADGSKSRRFCYRLDGENWGKVSWKKYNDKYGKLYCKNEAFIESIYEVMNRWTDSPFNALMVHDDADSELEDWARAHNSMINRIERNDDKRMSQHYLDNLNKQISKDLSDSAASLSEICQSRARQMRFLSTQRELTGFLKKGFEDLAKGLEYRAKYIDAYGEKLSEINLFRFKEESR